MDKYGNILLIGTSAALNIKVLYCTYPIADEVHVWSDSSDSFLRYSRHIKQFHASPLPQDAHAREEWARAIDRYCREHAIDVIVPADITATGTIHSVSEGLAVPIFPTSDIETLERIHNKSTFAEALQNAGISTPPTVTLEDIVDLDEALAASVGFPMMVKPLTCESSHGVVRIDDYRQLRHYLETPGPYKSLPLVLQKFIAGKDVDLSVLALDGSIAVHTVQDWRDSGTLLFGTQRDMLELGEAICQLYDFNGVAHFDMRQDAETGQFYVLECNPRFWYTLLASFWTGINFVEAGVRAALGQPLPHYSTAPKEYLLPGQVVKSMLREPGRVLSMSRNNWRGFIQPMLDIQPHLNSLWRKHRARRAV